MMMVGTQWAECRLKMRNAMTRVLVVDDDLAQQFLIGVVLKRAGYEAVEALNGLNALDLLKRDSRVDIVLTDLRMPSMDGARFMKEAQRLYPGLPIVVMTAHGGFEWMVDARKQGATGCISKPFIGPQLIDCLHDALERTNYASHLPDYSADANAHTEH